MKNERVFVFGTGIGLLVGIIMAAAGGWLCGCSRSGPSAAAILGGPLPASAADIRVGHGELVRRDGAKIMTDDFLSMAISREDFMTLAAKLKLRHDSHAFDQWSSPLKGPGQKVATEVSPVGLWSWKGETKQDTLWWTVNNTNDEDTLINFQLLLPESERTGLSHLTNIVARYENGRLFFRRQIWMWGSKPQTY